MSTTANHTDMLETHQTVPMTLQQRLQALALSNANYQNGINNIQPFYRNPQNINQQNTEFFQQGNGQIVENSTPNINQNPQNSNNNSNFNLPPSPELAKTTQNLNPQIPQNLEQKPEITNQNPTNSQNPKVELPKNEPNNSAIPKNEVKPFDRKVEKPMNFIARFKHFTGLEKYHHPKFESKKPRNFQEELNAWRQEAMSKEESHN